MSKTITLSIIAGIFAAISPAEAKISRCLNPLGDITFTDTSCNIKSTDQQQNTYISGIKPLFKKESALTKSETKVFQFYCHKRIGGFYEC